MRITPTRSEATVSLVAEAGFRREVGVIGLTFTSLGSVIGSGWLLGALHGAAAAGPASLVSWGIAGAMVTVLALIYAELGAAYPVTGGSVTFPILAFGGLAGMIDGWMAWIGTVSLAPIEVEAALQYLTNLKDLHWLTRSVNGGSGAVLTWPGFAVAVALLVAFAIINVAGVRWLAHTNSGAVWWKTAIPVITIVALILTSFHSGNFSAGGGFAPFGVKGIFAALPAGVMFALQGFEQATQLGAEARNPAKDIPRAVIGSVLIGFVLYFLLEVAFIGSLNPARLVSGWANPIGKGSFGPFAALASTAGLGWLAAIIYADAFVSPAGTGLVYTATSARISFAMSRSAYFPAPLRRLSGRAVPMVAVLASLVIGVLIFLPFGGWQTLVTFITSASALMYSFAPLSFAALRRQQPDRDRPYRLAGGRWWGPAGFVSANLIFYWGGWPTNWRLMVAVLIGVVLLGVTRLRKSPSDRPPLDWRSGWWVIPYLVGITAISAFGQYGAWKKVIPFWVDIAVVAVFSLAIFYTAVSRSLPREQGDRYLETIVDEMAVDPMTVAP